jgi:hypothetical protein
MAFSYTPGSTTSLNRVRLLLGDTDSSAPVQQRLEDEEITDLLTIAGGYRAGAAAAASALSGKFARLATSKSMGRASLVWQRFQQLRELAKDLQASVSLAAVPFAGGISQAIKDTNAADTDRVTPAFVKGMLDNPSSMNTTSS